MNYRKINSIFGVLVAALLAVTILSSCNARKKNTALSRQYTAFITRYNIYYNGDKHYIETLEDLEKNYEDDYTNMVYMHPVEAKNYPKAPQPSGDFNRSIEKAQKAIQIRSITKKPQKKRGKANNAEYKAWMKRDEYNPFLHNAWMMMGRSQYMNGDFLGAVSTFFYTSRHFSWLSQTVTEAKLWQARSYLGMDWLFEAENIITRIKPEELTTSTLQGLYNFVYADFHIKSKDYEAAVPYLQQAIKYAKGAQKIRLNFLLGQVYERLGKKQLAYQAFAKASGASNASYRTKFNARIKQSEVYEGNNIEPEVKALKRMARYDRNKEYLDQVYYAIGNLYLSRKDTARAIENYELAAKNSTRNGIDKAISQITLGGLYYDLHQYEKAQPCYAEAVPQLPDTYPNLQMLKRRSDVLDELSLYSQNVNLQDSLLRLSQMSPDEQMKIINKIIADLKKKEKEEQDEAKRQEYLANQSSQGSNLKSNTNDPNSFSINTDNSWYFYNSAAKAAGKTEFQRRWGSRKLEDDWRRRNKTSFNTSDFDGAQESEETDKQVAKTDSVKPTPEQEEKQKKESDPHFAEYYLKQIPSTDEEKATAHDVIQEGLFNMGVILKDKMEDFDGSYVQFNRLLTDYPDNIYRLDTYYNLYLMYVRLGQYERAEQYRQLILKDFAESKYGEALKNPNYIDNLRTMESQQQTLYENAFDAYMDNRNSEVHAIYKDVSERYPMTKLMPKFMFLEALAYVTDRRPEDFNSTLRTLLERYPDTDLTPTVSAWLKGMAQGRQLQAGVSGKNMRGMLWSISLGNDSTATASDSINFAINPADPLLLVFVFPTDKVSSNELLYRIARHNFRSFVVKDFDLEQMNFGRLGMILVKQFESMAELNHYRRVMAASTDFKLPAGVRPVVISVPNFDTLLHSGGTLDDYFRFLEAQNYKDAQADLLPYTEIETLEEADEAAAQRQQEDTTTTTNP
jgi:tetratricopeptide (TPR) repeat protein